jgi:hypothetical protein
MSSQTPNDDMLVKPSEKAGIRFPPGISAHCAGRLAPLALDNAKRKIDSALFSVTVGGLSQKQIDEVNFAATFKLERFRAATLALFAGWR